MAFRCILSTVRIFIIRLAADYSPPPRKPYLEDWSGWETPMIMVIWPTLGSQAAASPDFIKWTFFWAAGGRSPPLMCQRDIFFEQAPLSPSQWLLRADGQRVRPDLWCSGSQSGFAHAMLILSTGMVIPWQWGLSRCFFSLSATQYIQYIVLHSLFCSHLTFAREGGGCDPFN